MKKYKINISFAVFTLKQPIVTAIIRQFSRPRAKQFFFLCKFHYSLHYKNVCSMDNNINVKKKDISMGKPSNHPNFSSNIRTGIITGSVIAYRKLSMILSSLIGNQLIMARASIKNCKVDNKNDNVTVTK